ncbi:unnamed protein product [Mytilus coruscus]|uniref:B box-type domain-containing protein n=1 Tax=Mytilus coruscus TaxID=42192 RepID=A0A6J8C7P9_MYTCO|nr:unnamed protein product [Mytilus coruscus]
MVGCTTKVHNGHELIEEEDLNKGNNKCKDRVHQRIANDHRILDITGIGKQKGSNEIFTFSDVQCEVHSDQACCLYCTTCNTLICFKCSAKVHNGHELIDEEDYSKGKDKCKGMAYSRIANDHRILDITSIGKQEGSKETFRFSDVQCEVHFDQACCLYCTTCNTLICFKCSAKFHNGHELIDEEDFNKGKDKCKGTVHSRIANDHRILDITSIGKQEGSKETFRFSDVQCEVHFDQACCLYCTTCNTLICFKCSAKVHNGHELIDEEDYNKGKVEITPKQQSKIVFEISEEFTSDTTYLTNIVVLSNGSMWVGDNSKFKLQHVTLRGNSTEVIRSLNIKTDGMAKIHSNNILVTTDDETKLKLIDTITGQITDSVYDVKPLYPISIHVTSDHRVIIGAKSSGMLFPAIGRRAVIVLDQDGKQLEEYEHEKHNKRSVTLPKFLTINKNLFTYPRHITSTSNGNIFVVDRLDDDYRGRVVVLSQGGDILGTYTGLSEVNTDNDPFTPRGILTLPSDNIIVTDMDNHLLHILTDHGQIITYYTLQDMGIIYPYSLALSTTRTIYIGCVSEKGCPDTAKAKLYELEYPGI